MLACGRQACHIGSMGRAKRPRDTNQLAKAIVDLATGEVDESSLPTRTHQSESGKKGGQARAQKLSPGRRASIARDAAKARWDKSSVKID